MTIYICGGSNSMSESGWISNFRNMISDQKIENLSVGAAPSHMGVFRCCATADLQPGDTVIWEYGVNDINHIDRGGYTETEIQKPIEWLMDRCCEAGARFAALVFQPLRYEKSGTLSPYRKMLHQLFGRRGIVHFDVHDEYIKSNPGAKGIPADLYETGPHYAHDERFMQFIAAGAAGLVSEASTPSVRSAATTLQIYSQFQGGTARLFSNSRVAVNTWRPEGGVRGHLHADGRIVGFVIVSTPKGGVLEFCLGGEKTKLVAAHKDKKFKKPLLKFVSLPAVRGEEIHFEAGQEFFFSWAESADGAFADHGFKKNVGQPALLGREASVVALLTEERI
ncbi:hypothetical protein ACUXV3_17505 [Roseobacteraceae bacterium NS-SX3]